MQIRKMENEWRVEIVSENHLFILHENQDGIILDVWDNRVSEEEASEGNGLIYTRTFWHYDLEE
jgi:hypothetical protein